MSTVLSAGTSNNTQLVTSPQISTTNSNEDLEVFLNLLLTQLQNQDPLDPVDTEEYTSQLVQYSSLEQLMLLNNNAEVQNNIEASENTKSVLGYLNHEVELDTGTGVVQAGAAVWGIDLAADASNIDIKVYDADKNLVYSTTGNLNQGDHRIAIQLADFSGTVEEGDALTMEIDARTGNDALVTSKLTSWVIVNSVDTSGEDSAEPLLRAGDLKFDDGYIVSVVQPQLTQTPNNKDNTNQNDNS